MERPRLIELFTGFHRGREAFLEFLCEQGFPQLHELDTRLDVLGNVLRPGLGRVVQSALVRAIINCG